jgi:hypothetical protein
MKFHENSSGGSRDVPSRAMDAETAKWNCYLALCKHLDGSSGLCVEPSINQWRHRGQCRWSWSHAILILAVYEGDVLALCFGRFNPGKTATGWCWWPVWGDLEKRKICYSSRESNPEFSIVWPVKKSLNRLSYWWPVTECPSVGDFQKNRFNI